MSDKKWESLGPIHEPQEVLLNLARVHEVVAPGENLTENLQELLYSVVRLCADAVDEYGDEGDGNAGEHIRSLYLPA